MATTRRSAGAAASEAQDGAVSPAAAQEPHPSDDDSDSDYETETYYLTLSLPVSLPSTLPSSNPHHNNLPAPPSPPRSSPSRLQLSGLDTPHPLLSFRNKLYTGTHTVGLGSEIHVLHRGEAEFVDGGIRRKATAYGDSSAASAYLGRQRRGQRMRKAREEGDGEEGEGEEGEGEVVAVVPEAARIAFEPVGVVAKEWSFREQQSAKEGFLKRLEGLQVRKGEREAFKMPATDGRGEVVEKKDEGGRGKEAVEVEEEVGERPVVVGGYFAKPSDEDGRESRTDGGEDVVMVDAA